jgi:pyruvate dehydrogenase E2 component (dihydrolipoamide acetyltransferase)
MIGRMAADETGDESKGKESCGMAEAVLMPKSGISVETSLIGSWKKNVGDKVGIGEILFEYETDKAQFECESTAAGILLEKFYEEGDEVEVMKPVCAIGEEGEDVSALRAEAGAPVAPAEAPAPADAAPAPAATPAPEVAQPPAPAAASAPSGDGAAKSSPRARGLADKLGIDIAAVPPSGPDGRVVEEDVRAYAATAKQAATAPAAATASAAAPTTAAAGPEYTDEKFTKIREVIASAMSSSLHGMAQLTHQHSFDASLVMKLRAELKASGDEALAGVSIGDIILYAVSRALMDYPEVNSLLIDGNTFRRYSTVHLGVAVDTPRGLMVPVIKNADRKSLPEISAEVKNLAAAARSGSINPDLLSGGTFTVSNLGPTGVESFTPIINPPQVAILGVCGSVTRVREGRNGIETYPSIGLSLTYDHRALDGAPASRFAQALCTKLESVSLLL